jgi:hypothetical protein
VAEKVPQTYANHARFDPPYHFFVAPVFGITVLLAVWNLFRNFSFASAWLVVLSLAALVAVVKFRLYALKAQDRVIRLEERLRLLELLPEPLRSRIGDLTEAQLISLRFAGDSEVPALAEKALASKLPPAEIKKAIVVWRADYFRV